MASDRIMVGHAEVILAGGAESMSMVPMGGNKVSPNPWLVDNAPDTYISMGLGTEHLGRKYGITREQADEFSLQSHKKALAAIAAGKFKEEIVPVEVKITAVENGSNGSALPGSGGGGAALSVQPATTKDIFRTHEGPRPHTSLEAPAKPKPALPAQGPVT